MFACQAIQEQLPKNQMFLWVLINYKNIGKQMFDSKVDNSMTIAM